MLKEYRGFRRVYLACGYTDLRNGIDGLAASVQNQFHLDPFDKGTMFLFGGRRTDRIKVHTPAKLSHLIRTLRATLSGDTEPVNPAMRATLPNRDYSECCMRMLIRHFSY